MGKELMGVYLSEHPFSAFADKIAAENTILAGRLTRKWPGNGAGGGDGGLCYNI